MTTTTTATESPTGGGDPFDAAYFGSYAWQDYARTTRFLGSGVLKVNTRDTRGTFVGQLIRVGVSPDNGEIAGTFELRDGRIEVVRVSELLSLCPPLSGKTLERATGGGTRRVRPDGTPVRKRGKIMLTSLSAANLQAAFEALRRATVPQVDLNDAALYDFDAPAMADLDDEAAMDVRDAHIRAETPDPEPADLLALGNEALDTAFADDPFTDDVYPDTDIPDLPHLPEQMLEEDEAERPAATSATKTRGKGQRKAAASSR